jgi:VWFA-related protein
MTRTPSSLRRLVRLALAGSLGLIALAGAGMAQETIVESNKFFDVVKVNVVNVETFVTGRDGKPVLGLTPDDFEITVDGEPVAIRNFFTVEGARVRQLEVAERAGAEPKDVAPADLPDYQRLNLIVYVDNSAIQPRSRNRVLGQLKKLLASELSHDDRVMVATQGSRLDIRLSFSDPPERLGPVLDAMAHEVGKGGLFVNDRNFILRTMERTNTTTPQRGSGQDTRVEEAKALLQDIEGWCQYKYEVTRASIRTLRQLVDSLAGLPGRKAVLYVGEGVSMRIGEPLFEAWVAKFSRMWSTVPDVPMGLRGFSPQTAAGRYNVRPFFRELADRANSNRVTLYAIDASQGVLGSYVTASNPGYEGGSQLSVMQAFGDQEALQFLAGTTGGRQITNLENVALALDQLRSDFDSYYSLGFTPSGEPDGKYHRIKVAVKRGGVTVRHREGFRSKSPDELMSNRTLSAVFLGVTANPLDIALETGVAHRDAANGEYLLPVNVVIPLGRLLLLPAEDVHEGRLTVFIAVRGADGRSSDVQRRELPLRVPNEVVLESGDRKLNYSIDLMMREGEQTVAVGVRDELAEIDSTVSVGVTIGGASG